MAGSFESIDGGLLWAKVSAYVRFVVVAYWLLSATLLVVRPCNCMALVTFSWLIIFSCFGRAANAWSGEFSCPSNVKLQVRTGWRDAFSIVPELFALLAWRFRTLWAVLSICGQPRWGMSCETLSFFLIAMYKELLVLFLLLAWAFWLVAIVTVILEMSNTSALVTVQPSPALVHSAVVAFLFSFWFCYFAVWDGFFGDPDVHWTSVRVCWRHFYPHDEFPSRALVCPYCWPLKMRLC